MDVEFTASADTVGDEPANVLTPIYNLSDETAGRDDSLRAIYLGTNAPGTICELELTTGQHYNEPSPVEPTLFSSADYVLDASIIFTVDAKLHWRILPGPADYDGQTALVTAPVKALILQEKTPFDGALRRTLWLIPGEPGEAECDNDLPNDGVFEWVPGQTQFFNSSSQVAYRIRCKWNATAWPLPGAAECDLSQVGFQPPFVDMTLWRFFLNEPSVLRVDLSGQPTFELDPAEVGMVDVFIIPDGEGGCRCEVRGPNEVYVAGDYPTWDPCFNRLNFAGTIQYQPWQTIEFGPAPDPSGAPL